MPEKPETKFMNNEDIMHILATGNQEDLAKLFNDARGVKEAWKSSRGNFLFSPETTQFLDQYVTALTDQSIAENKDFKKRVDYFVPMFIKQKGINQQQLIEIQTQAKLQVPKILNEIKDTKKQYHILKGLRNCALASEDTIYKHVVKNEHATPDDFSALLKHCGYSHGSMTATERERVIQDALTVIKNEISAETLKAEPDIETINGLVRTSHEIENFSAIKPKKYRFESSEIYSMGIEEYLSKDPHGLEKQVAELTTQNRKLQLQSEETARKLDEKQNQLDAQQKQLDDALAQIAQLTEQLNQTKSKLKNANLKLGQIKAEAKSMQAGMGSKGVNDFKKMLDGMEF